MTKNTNEMKANELMIGDWVRTEAGALIVAGVGHKIYCRANDGSPTHLWEVTSIEPIPLTAEILEKNGFKARDYEYLVLETDEYCFWLQKGEDGINAWWWMEGFSLVTPINCVHELQHALRLCGIDKELTI